MRRFGHTLSAEECDEMFRVRHFQSFWIFPPKIINFFQEADLNRDGIIDWNEFLEMMLPGHAHASSTWIDNLLSLSSSIFVGAQRFNIKFYLFYLNSQCTLGQKPPRYLGINSLELDVWKLWKRVPKNVNFVKNETLKMWISSKVEFSDKLPIFAPVCSVWKITQNLSFWHFFHWSKYCTAGIFSLLMIQLVKRGEKPQSNIVLSLVQVSGPAVRLFWPWHRFGLILPIKKRKSPLFYTIRNLILLQALKSVCLFYVAFFRQRWKLIVSVSNLEAFSFEYKRGRSELLE